MMRLVLKKMVQLNQVVANKELKKSIFMDIGFIFCLRLGFG